MVDWFPKHAESDLIYLVDQKNAQYLYSSPHVTVAHINFEKYIGYEVANSS